MQSARFETSIKTLKYWKDKEKTHAKHQYIIPIPTSVKNAIPDDVWKFDEVTITRKDGTDIRIEDVLFVKGTRRQHVTIPFGIAAEHNITEENVSVVLEW